MMTTILTNSMQPYSLVSKSKYQVFENFLDDPDEVLEFSKSSNYYTAKQYAEYNKSESIGKWPGPVSYTHLTLPTSR